MTSFKKFSLIVLIIGYFIAGANHFVHPDSYLHIIPSYIILPHIVNLIAGAAEIILAILLIFPKTRSLAAWGIIVMLALFLPVHVSMLANAPVKVGTLIVTVQLALLRLALQPVLMLWAWWHTKEW